MIHHKVSLCIVCMNRTEHLKGTLLQNIRDNIAYDNLEFVLLDYGSEDDLHSWAAATLGEYIQKGILHYFRNTAPRFFHMSHAKNMAFKLGTGAILCSVDADNYTGPGFAAYVNDMFNKRGNIFLAPPRIGPERKWWDVQGRICLQSTDFLALRGYDERIQDYGYEDQDLKKRLSASGKKKITIRSPAFLHAIPHDDCLRIAAGLSARNTKELFVATDAKGTSAIIYLRQDQTFEYFYLKEHRGVLKNRHIGKYIVNGNRMQLLKENGTPLLQLTVHTAHHMTSADNRDFYRITCTEASHRVLLKRAIYLGKQILLENRRNGHIVNPAGFGEGQVYKNFSRVCTQV